MPYLSPSKSNSSRVRVCAPPSRALVAFLRGEVVVRVEAANAITHIGWGESVFVSCPIRIMKRCRSCAARCISLSPELLVMKLLYMSAGCRMELLWHTFKFVTVINCAATVKLFREIKIADMHIVELCEISFKPN